MQIFNSVNYVRIDNFLDYVPFVSTGKGLVELFLKKKSGEFGVKQNRYYIYLRDKPVWRSVTILFPFLGNFVVLFYDLVSLYRSRKKDLSSKPEQKLEKQEVVDAREAEANYKLGLCYKQGKGVAKDESKAKEFYEKAAGKNHLLAMLKLGWLLQETKGNFRNEQLGFEWMKKAADENYLNAQCDVGYCYEYGKGVVKDESKSKEYYQKAAEKNHPKGMYNLGLLLQKENASLGFDWIKKAADAGCMKAQFTTGYCYQWEKGTGKDEAKAVEYYQKAAEKKYLKAMYNLGWLLLETTGPLKNDKLGFEWMKKAADGGHPSAQINVGHCYKVGKGVSKDETKGIEYQQKGQEGKAKQRAKKG